MSTAKFWWYVFGASAFIYPLLLSYLLWFDSGLDLKSEAFGLALNSVIGLIAVIKIHSIISTNKNVGDFEISIKDDGSRTYSLSLNNSVDDVEKFETISFKVAHKLDL